MMLRFYGDQILAANPGLDNRLLTKFLVRALDIADDGGFDRLEDYSYPDPDTPHPVGDKAMAREDPPGAGGRGQDAGLRAGARLRPGRRFPPAAGGREGGGRVRLLGQPLRLPARPEAGGHPGGRGLKRPRLDFLEFFAGAGLVRLALEPEWRCVWANDVSAKKAEVYRANFGEAEFRLDDVARVKADELPDAALAWASFPCQDLSLAGWRRGISAPRSGTFWEFWRLMREMGARRPRLIVLENVVGLLYGDNFSGLCEALAALDLRFGAMVIDAKWFLPQSRPRVFLVAVDAAVDVAGKSGPEDSGPGKPGGLRHAWEALPDSLKERWVWWRLPEPAGPARRLDRVDHPDQRRRAGLVRRGEVERLCGMMTPAECRQAR